MKESVLGSGSQPKDEPGVMDCYLAQGLVTTHMLLAHEETRLGGNQYTLEKSHHANMLYNVLSLTFFFNNP